MLGEEVWGIVSIPVHPKGVYLPQPYGSCFAHRSIAMLELVWIYKLQ